MIAFFYGYFSYFFVGVVIALAGYGLSLWRQLLPDVQPHGEQLSGRAPRQMRTGMSMFLTGLILLVLFSIVGIISHKLTVVVLVLIGSVIGTFLVTVLYTMVSMLSKENKEK